MITGHVLPKHVEIRIACYNPEKKGGVGSTYAASDILPISFA
jgi:hypothetical protein